MSNKLYSMLMKALGKLLGSAARTEVLRVLTCQPSPVGLRHVSRIAGIHPRSAELALKALVSEKLVKRNRRSGRSLYEMNHGHPDMPVLEAVFGAVARAATGERCSSLHQRARAILPFIEEATRMLTCARRSRHVT